MDNEGGEVQEEERNEYEWFLSFAQMVCKNSLISMERSV